MDNAIDLTMFDDASRPNSPHNTKETAIVIDDSSDDEGAQKMPASSSLSSALSSAVQRATAMFSGRTAQSVGPQRLDFSSPGQGGEASKLPPVANNCAACGKQSTNLKKCSGCKSVHYCNSSCQFSHWTAHKDACRMARGGGGGSASVKREKYATSTTARVSLSPTPMNQSTSLAPPSGPWGCDFCNRLFKTHHEAFSHEIGCTLNPNKNTKATTSYECSICSTKFHNFTTKRRHEKKCRKAQRKKIKAERRMGNKVKAEGAATKQPAKEKEEGEDVEEADEITYTSYKPQKVTWGHPHPDPVVENSTLSAVEPPNVEYNLAMPADILSKGLLSNLQLEAIVYGCQRHLIDLPLKEDHEFLGEDKKPSAVEKKPDRAGFLLGDGAGMGKVILLYTFYYVHHDYVNFFFLLTHHRNTMYFFCSNRGGH